MKKYLSVMLALAMLITFLISPTSANGIIGNLETDIPIQGFSELSVRTIINNYFAQRKAYLQNTADTIDAAVTPMVTDEAAHREALAEANAVLTNSTVVINTVVIGDYVADVEATETATFVINGETVQESVVHKICVYEKNDGSLSVGSDGYMITATGFISASYVNPAAVELANIIPEGSPECILEIAYGEIGTTYPVGGATKYGIWYGDMLNDSGFDTDDWCAMFVVWCANQCFIPTYVIPLLAYCPTMAGHFNNKGIYYPSASGGGNYTPQPGDIIFLGYNETDTFLSPRHVGIVSFVSNGVVYFIDGNVTTTINGVTMKTVSHSQESLTSTRIIAYANPWYTHYSHPIRYDEWEYNNSMHWAFCVACDAQVLDYHDFTEVDEGFACMVCGYVRPA